MKNSYPKNFVPHTFKLAQYPVLNRISTYYRKVTSSLPLFFMDFPFLAAPKITYRNLCAPCAGYLLQWVSICLFFIPGRPQFCQLEVPTHKMQKNIAYLHLREYQKDLEYRLHGNLSKFDRSVFLISKPSTYIYFLVLIWLGFCLETMGVHQIII